MHVVSVVTLLLGSIFVYSNGAPQFGPNLNSITLALAQLAQQLAQLPNSTVRLNNGSLIVSGLSNSVANANIDVPNNNGLSPDWSNGWNNGWNNAWNNGWTNYWNGFWRGNPEYDGLSEDEESEMEVNDVDNEEGVEDEKPIDEQD